jgi:hypothetical protein
MGFVLCGVAIACSSGLWRALSIYLPYMVTNIGRITIHFTDLYIRS